jgi:hypothetical protein
MRRWQFWWHDLMFTARQNPPQVVEGVMLVLAALLCVAWFMLQRWQYLVLCLNYIIGAIASILVREFMAPSPQTRQIRLTAVFSLALLLSLASFYFNKVFHLHPSFPLFNTLSV